MAGSKNKVNLMGHVGKDPQVSTLNNGDRVAKLTIATTESWKDKNTGERREKTEWHNVVIFNEALVKLAESYIKKGSYIDLDGAQIQTRKWTDQNGQERWTTEIVVQKFKGEIQLLDKKGEGGGGGGGERGGGEERRASSNKPAQQQRQDPDDDIPF